MFQKNDKVYRIRNGRKEYGTVEGTSWIAGTLEVQWADGSMSFGVDPTELHHVI